MRSDMAVEDAVRSRIPQLQNKRDELIIAVVVQSNTITRTFRKIILQCCPSVLQITQQMFAGRINETFSSKKDLVERAEESTQTLRRSIDGSKDVKRQLKAKSGQVTFQSWFIQEKLSRVTSSIRSVCSVQATADNLRLLASAGSFLIH